MELELPKLTKKQQTFVMRYVVNGDNATEAYRYAYDCKLMKEENINSEASKLLKNPKVTQWIKLYKSNVQKVCQAEVIYTAKQAFSELNELQARCSESLKTYSVEKSCIDTKCKIAGLFTDTALTQAVTVNMGNIKVDGNDLNFEIGEEISQ